MWTCIIMEKYNVCPIDKSRRCFFIFSYTSYNSWEYKSALRVWLQFKNSKWIIPCMIPPYTQYSFSSMKFYFWDKLQWFILVNQLRFAKNIVIKDPFFDTYNDILETLVIFLPLKMTRSYGYMIFLILLTRSMRKPNVQLAHFFKW